MDITKKLQILSDAAKYDISCSSSGSKRKNTKNGIGNAASNGICILLLLMEDASHYLKYL